MRKAKQCKDKWHNMNIKIRGFNSMWCGYNNQYSSGQADEDLVENTMKFYKQMTGQPFTHYFTYGQPFGTILNGDDLYYYS
jgi:hypothetical protein